MNDAVKIVHINSKRNNVWLCAKGADKFVKKEFECVQNYITEKQIYNVVKNNSVKLCPQLLEYNDSEKAIVFEYIDGITVLERLEQLEQLNDVDNAYKLFIKLFDWLKNFHIVLENKLIMQDTHLRNFLLKDDNIIGVDFEQCTEGEAHSDYLYAVAMFSLYNPIDSPFKRKVIDELFSGYFQALGYSCNSFNHLINKQIEMIVNRRK